MRAARKKRLEAAGWRVGTAEEFLDLSPEEARVIDTKLALGGAVSPRRPRGLASRQPAQATTATRVFALRVSLRDIEPEIWRSVQVASALTLFKLHRVLQTVMGWTNSHMHQFRVGEVLYGPLDPEFPQWLDEKKVLLADVLRAPGDQLEYTYDLGDDWEHDIVLDQVLDPDPAGKYPCVTGGMRACPPEDCGGAPGYEHLLVVLAKPRHPEHRDLLEWVGGSFDPEAFDAGAINRALRGVAIKGRVPIA